MDVKTAFLYGDIEEEIVMKPPIGMQEIDPLLNFGAYRLEFSSSILQPVGLGGFFCQLNVQNKEAWLKGYKPAKMLCTGHREFGTNR